MQPYVTGESELLFFSANCKSFLLLQKQYGGCSGGGGGGEGEEDENFQMDSIIE